MWGGLSGDGYGRLYTLIMCSNQLLASKTQSNFNLRNKITQKIAVFMIPIFLHGKNLHYLILLQT